MVDNVNITQIPDPNSSNSSTITKGEKENIKGTVCVVSSDTPCTDGNARFTSQMKINSLKKQKY